MQPRHRRRRLQAGKRAVDRQRAALQRRADGPDPAIAACIGMSIGTTESRARHAVTVTRRRPAVRRGHDRRLGNLTTRKPVMEPHDTARGTWDHSRPSEAMT